jgi:hypothetical protein
VQPPFKKVEQQPGHTHMVKDVYRKESNENCLQKRKSGEFQVLSSYQGSMADIQVKQNNIIIDLTNQLYEEGKAM